MKKPYEIYGIPSECWLEYEEPPDYAIVIEDNEVDDPFYTPFRLAPGDMRLWGKAAYWTALEASLLLGGVSPDDTELYAVGQISVPDEGYGTKISNWKYAPVFHHAKQYLFLFERSVLAPKAPPIEWVKYFSQKIYNKRLKYGFEPAFDYHDQWLELFSEELSEINQTKNNEKPESTRKTENLLRAITAIAIDAYGYDPKSAKSTAPHDITDAISTQGKDFDKKTIRGWLKDGASLLEIEQEKD